jgi:hypothetical protein
MSEAAETAALLCRIAFDCERGRRLVQPDVERIRGAASLLVRLDAAEMTCHSVVRMRDQPMLASEPEDHRWAEVLELVAAWEALRD